MTSTNISLPESLRQYVERQVESGDWGTPGEYIRELVRQDRDRRLAALEESLLEGLASPRFELDADEIRSKGVVSALRKIRPE
jgi:antitoxin ParD1/3/4